MDFFSTPRSVKFLSLYLYHSDDFSYSTPVYLFTYLVHEAESFLRNSPVFSYSRNSPHFMESEDSPPHSQVPPVPILSQLDSVHTPTFHFLKIHLNIILPSTHGSPKLSLSYIRLLSHPYVLHAPPSSFFSSL